MSKQYHFDLGKALAAWRRSLTHNRAFTPDDLDELEQHLRDQVAGLMMNGWTEEVSFRQALREMGDYGTAEAEYRKVYWSKRRHRGEVLRELTWRLAMLKNYMKVAFRTLLRQKGYSFLNIAGLAVGLACAFLIALWIRDEVSYDRFHESADRIYRVRRHVQFGGDQIYTQESAPWPLAQTLVESYPEVEDVALITWPETLVFNQRERSTSEEGLYANVDFFKLFSWHLIQGDRSTVLQDPTALVISASLAEKYFGSEWRERDAAIGQTIRLGIDEFDDFTVTGVFEDIPHNSSLQFDFVLPIEAYVRRTDSDRLSNWSNNQFLLYVRLREGADGAVLSEKIVDLQNDHIEGFRSDLFLLPFTDQHLRSTFEDGVRIVSRLENYIQMFGIVACMIVLIACINFMNLGTARSMRRAREVGVRKAVGAGRRTLVGQFMGESLLLVLIAFVLAIGLVVAALPVFNALTEKEVMLADLQGSTLLLFAGIGLLTALMAGAYPALYLSSFEAVRVLRGTFRLGSRSARLRQGLVVFQFAMSILLIVGTITVYQQIGYIHSKDLGLDRENVVLLPMEGEMRGQFDTVKEVLLEHPGIAAVTSASSNPLDVGSSTHTISWQGKDPDSEIEMYILSTSFDFLDVMRMELAQGRGFDSRFGTDSVNYIINEAALKVMGLENPLGEQLALWGNESGSIVGVVKDFHMASLYSEIAPTIMRLRPQETSWLYVRTDPDRTEEALASLEAVCSTFNPAYPFTYQFLDERFRQTYRSETIIGKLAGYFTVIALFISCLGLFGLATFAAQQRTKEIGVRKVLGASISGVAVLLSKDFVKLVLLAFILAAPVGYVIMQRWLDDFAYRTDLSVWIFVGAGVAAVGIALLTVSYQSIKAARINPVESLRYE